MPNPSRWPRGYGAGRVGHLVVLRCPRICSRSTGMNTCGLTLKTEEESAENRTEVPHPSLQTTDGRIGHPPLHYRAGDSCLRHPPEYGSGLQIEAQFSSPSFALPGFLLVWLHTWSASNINRS